MPFPIKLAAFYLSSEEPRDQKREIHRSRLKFKPKQKNKAFLLTIYGYLSMIWVWMDLAHGGLDLKLDHEGLHLNNLALLL